MRLENISLNKELPRLREESYTIAQDSFACALKQVARFYPARSIYREQVSLNHAFEDVEVVSLVD